MTIFIHSVRWLDFLGLFLMLSGIIIGLGSVTVIDIHGFLSRKSSYWMETTTRVHKVTKPLIWTGIIVATLGGLIFYRHQEFGGIPMIHGLISLGLMINGYWLSYPISSHLLKREKENRQRELLAAPLQKKLILHLLLSAIGWWGGVALLVIYLLNQS